MFIVKINPVAKEHIRPLEKAKQINQSSPLPFFFLLNNPDLLMDVVIPFTASLAILPGNTPFQLPALCAVPAASKPPVLR